MTGSTAAGTGIQRDPLLQLAALCLGAAGLGVVRYSPLAGLALFAAGGTCLALARRGQGDILDDLIPPAAPRTSWEPWYLVLLLVLGLLSFGWHLGSIPEGANYSEGYLASRAMAMGNNPDYIPHDDAFGTAWPTLYHYEGFEAVKWLGFSPASFRSVSVLWALIVLFGVYFTVRILFSVPTAVVLSFLWLAFHFNMHFARRYCPIIMLYLPPFAGFAAVVLGLRSGKWWWWVAAGFLVGVAVHGYLPGRMVPAVFLLLSAALWMKRARWGLDSRQLVLMWATIFIVSSPIINYAMKHSDDYNAALKLDTAIDVNAGFHSLKSLKPLWDVFSVQIGPYLEMFHVRGNSEYEEDDSYGRPVLDPVMGLLFPLGFFACFWRFRRLLPFYVIVLFGLGIFPGIYSKLGIAPFPRREVIAFPAVFLAGALALEEFRLGLFKGLSTRRWVTAWLLVGSFLLVRQWKHYWDYTHTPGFRRFTDVMGYDEGQELRAMKPGTRVIATQCILQSSPSRNILTKPDVPIREIIRAEDYLFQEPGQDLLILLSPYLEVLLPTLRQVYPHADVKLYREPAYDDPVFLKDQMDHTIFGAFSADITNPSLSFARVLVPAADLDARAGWMDLGSPGAVLKNSDTKSAEERAGKLLHVGCTVEVDTEGNTLVVRLPWPGWRLKVDGESRPLNKPYFARGDFRYVELEGRVPAGAKGAFPARVLLGKAESPVNLLAWRTDQGLTVDYMRGVKPDLDRKEDYSATMMVPALRWAEDYKLVDYPGQIRVKGSFVPPSSGLWHLRLRWPGTETGKVSLAGAVDVPGAIGGPGTEVAGTLVAGVPAALRVDYPMNLSMAQVTAFLLEVRAPGDDRWHWIDPQTLRPR